MWFENEIKGILSVQPGGDGNNYTIQGATELCGSEIYSISNLPSNTIVTWSTTGTAVIVGSSTENTVIIARDYYLGPETLTATIQTGSCGTVTVAKEILVSDLGDIPIEIVGGENPFCLGGIYTLSVDPIFDSYQWDVYGASYIGANNTNSVQIQVPSDFNYYKVNIDLWVTKCGGANLQTIEIPVQNCSNYYVYPNPVNTMLRIGKSEEGKSKNSSESYIKSNESIDEVKVFDDKGNVVKMIKNQKNLQELQIDTSHIREGTYFLHIIKGKTTVKKQIIIKHSGE